MTKRWLAEKKWWEKSLRVTTISVRHSGRFFVFPSKTLLCIPYFLSPSVFYSYIHNYKTLLQRFRCDPKWASEARKTVLGDVKTRCRMTESGYDIIHGVFLNANRRIKLPTITARVRSHILHKVHCPNDGAIALTWSVLYIPKTRVPRNDGLTGYPVPYGLKTLGRKGSAGVTRGGRKGKGRHRFLSSTATERRAQTII